MQNELVIESLFNMSFNTLHDVTGCYVMILPISIKTHKTGNTGSGSMSWRNDVFQVWLLVGVYGGCALLAVLTMALALDNIPKLARPFTIAQIVKVTAKRSTIWPPSQYKYSICVIFFIKGTSIPIHWEGLVDLSE